MMIKIDTSKKYKTKAAAMRGGRILLAKLQERIDKNPKVFCENYGQKEISDFEQRLSDLHYVDKCDVMATVYRVDRMTPNV